MTKEELEKDYYANRPIEPYSSDGGSNDWANIAHYAEENLERAFKRIVELECECRRCVYTDCPCILSDYGKNRNGICDHFKDVFDENVELKAKIGLSIDCEKAQKNRDLCLGYGGDEDEPCERCKNCIKCECGYYQLGETEKDNRLTKAKEIKQ